MKKIERKILDVIKKWYLACGTDRIFFKKINEKEKISGLENMLKYYYKDKAIFTIDLKENELKIEWEDYANKTYISRINMLIKTFYEKYDCVYINEDKKVVYFDAEAGYDKHLCGVMVKGKEYIKKAIREA